MFDQYLYNTTLVIKTTWYTRRTHLLSRITYDPLRFFWGLEKDDQA